MIPIYKIAQLRGNETQKFRIKILIWKQTENAPNSGREHTNGEVK
jgi:hypothetical protein